MTDQENRYRYNIVDVCENIASAVTGTGEPMNDEDMIEAVNWLYWRITHWEQPSTRYTNAMLELACAAAAKGFEELVRRGRWAGSPPH